MSNLSRAGRAEILRASQKDDEFCDQLKIVLSDLVGDVAGQRLWLSRHNVLDHVTKLVYRSCTTLRNLQTLGEEYTGIIQVDGTLRNLPSKSRLACSILLESGGELMLQWLVVQCTRHFRNISRETALTLMTTAKVILQHFHKTLFYLTGDYYSVSKRITGIHYVLFRGWLKDKESRKAFHWLGIVSAIYLGVSVVHTLRNKQIWLNHQTVLQTSRSSLSADPSTRCSLCLETRTNTSCTPCGHLFCWACIHEWLASKSECPLCREQVLPSRIISLQNY